MTRAVSEYCLTIQSAQDILMSGKVAVTQFLEYNVSVRAAILSGMDVVGKGLGTVPC
jgi:hypothetical protein